jgi:hypothetical protein
MWKLSLAVVSMGVALSGCGGYVEGSEEYAEDVESLGEAACANPEGANYSLASLAAATALDMKRWQTATDFAIVVKCNYSMAGCQKVVELTNTGRAACTDGCRNVQAILDWQKKEASGKIKFPGGATLQSDIFASRLAANLEAQITCNSRLSDNGGNCPAEKHTLAFSGASKGTCEMDYWFHAYKAGTTEPLATPWLLKNQLITFGSLANNPYLAFDVQGDDVKVDPGPNTVGGDPASSGNCPTLTSNVKFSTVDIRNKCCYYGNTNQKKFVRTAFSNDYYYCQ